MGVIEKVSARIAPSVLVPGELPLDRIVMPKTVTAMVGRPAISILNDSGQ